MTPEKFLKALSKVRKELPGSIPYNREYRIYIKERFHGQTLAEVYEQTMPHLLEDWHGLIESGKILLEGKQVTGKTKVKAGQVSTRIINKVTEPGVSTNIKLVEANDYFWVLEKPSPLPMHGAGRFYKNTLSYFLTVCFGERNFHLVHRLDANTTGLVIVALDKNTATHFIHAFKNKEVEKEYLAIVEREIIKKRFTITDSIGKDTELSGSRSVKTGISAKTHVEVLKATKHYSLLGIKPTTGRTNQIRLHLANAGFAIKGDLGYANKEYFKSNPMTYAEDSLFLHAYKLSFTHPENGKKVSYTSSIPDKFSLVLK